MLSHCQLSAVSCQLSELSESERVQYEKKKHPHCLLRHHDSVHNQNSSRHRLPTILDPLQKRKTNVLDFDAL